MAQVTLEERDGVAVLAADVPLQRVDRAGRELIDDEPVEPGRDQREPAGGGGEVAFDGGHGNQGSGVRGQESEEL